MKMQVVRVECQKNPELWFSEDKNDMADAISICNRCPLKDTCLRQAIENHEVNGIWGGVSFNSSKYQSMNKVRGLCRNGKHELPNGGPCAECRKATRKKHDQKKKARYRAEGRYQNKGKKHKNVVGGKCKNGHDLNANNTKVRSYDGALMCTQCYRRVQPKIIPRTQDSLRWRFSTL